jgi:RNA polymerase sigma factor (sigma-70 family)
MKRPLLRLPLAALPDADLAGMAATGDEAAYEAIVRRYEPALRRYCRRLTRDGARADDAVQQALVSAWTALRQGAEVRELKPWLHRIAHNAVVRAVTREREFPAPADVHGQAMSVSAVAELSMETRAALTALAALPEHQRAAMVGTAIDGRSRGEMARELGLSEGAVRQLLHRARATLREATAALTPLNPAVRFLRRRAALPVPEALASESTGALAETVWKVGAILAATGALAAVPVAHTVRSLMQTVSQPVESVAGLPSGTDNAVAPARIELPPHGYEPGSGGRGRSPADAVAIAAPDVTANADDQSDGGNADQDTGEAAGDNADAGIESSGSSSDDGADQSADPGADAAADPAQAPDAADPAADAPPPVDPTPDPAPAEPLPPDPLIAP